MLGWKDKSGTEPGDLKQMKQPTKSKSQKTSAPIWLNATLLAITFSVLLFVRLYVNQGVTGDEPHYLLMDYSLIHDHDLNLKNNYANKDYLSFYPGILSPFEQVGANQMGPHDQKQYSIHTIGLPLAMVPGFIVAEKWGVVVEMVLVATIVVWLTWIWTARLTGSRKLAYVTAACLVACYSFNGLAGYIYPDMLLAALTLGSLIIIDGFYNRWAFQLLFGLMIGFMVLVHFKALAFVVPLLALITYKNWRYNKHAIPWLAFIGALPLIAYFFLSLHSWFGVWDPSKTYSEGYNFLSPPLPIISGFLFDSIRGLLVNNPILDLLFVGLPIWYKRRRETFIIALVATLPFMGVVATFSGWQGGDSTIDRYLIDFLPVFLPAVGFALSELRQLWQRIVAGLLFMATLLISLDATLTKWPYVRLETKSPLFVQIQNHTGLALNHFFPTFSNTTSITAVSTLMYRYGVLKLIFDYTGLALLVAYGVFLSRPMAPKAGPSTRRARP